MKRAAPNQKKILLAPKTAKILETVGEQIRLARLRRKLSVALVAERAGVSRQTVWKRAIPLLQSESTQKFWLQ